MNIEEFSNGFTNLLNSYALKSNFGEQSSIHTIELDEYEKSLFLTKAQEELVVALYKGQTIEGKSFEETEALRRSLDSLVRTETLTTPIVSHPTPVCDDSIFYSIPTEDKVMFITLEQVIFGGKSCVANKRVNVYPTTQDEFNIIKDNPFRGASDRRVLRLDCGENIMELISKYPISSYIIRYLKRPNPIILIGLTSSNLTIDGTSPAQTSELPEILHETILERAVLMALRTKGINTDK